MEDAPGWRRFVPFVLAIVFAGALAILIYRADHAADLRDRAAALQRHSYQVMLQAKTVEARVGSAEMPPVTASSLSTWRRLREGSWIMGFPLRRV